MNPLIVIPTLNESSTIRGLLIAITELRPDSSILIIDGGSDDGTIEIVREIQTNNPHIELVIQDTGHTFGAALRLGFKHAIKHRFDPVITMDGDFSHDPVYLNGFFEQALEYDLVVGSRYINGVRVEGWKFRNLLLSKLANMYVSYIFVKPIWDFTSGYRCYRLEFLMKLNIDELSDHAYIVQIQLLYLAFKMKQRVKEIPFVYHEIEGSVSKVFTHAKKSTFLWVLKYRAPISEIWRHLTYVRKDYKRFVREYEELINPPKLKQEGHFDVKKKYSVTVGIMAYNEEKMIGRCLDGLLKQNINNAIIEQIIVVSSGSTDRTNDIVTEYSGRYPVIKLLVQHERKGKANAINEFLKEAESDIVIIESADTTTEPNTIAEMIRHFKNKKVGIVGAHPVPVNKGKRFVDYCVQKLWHLHHLMALDHPKCGEMIAFRNIITKISDYTAVDEAAIESVFTHYNFKLAYASEAIVHNKGPETLREFIRQRRRIAAGHRHLLKNTGHIVPSYSNKKILDYVLRTQIWRPKQVIYTAILIGVEGFSRLVGFCDYYLRDKNPFIWDIAKTTKNI